MTPFSPSLSRHDQWDSSQCPTVNWFTVLGLNGSYGKKQVECQEGLTPQVHRLYSSPNIVFLPCSGHSVTLATDNVSRQDAVPFAGRVSYQQRSIGANTFHHADKLRFR